MTIQEGIKITVPLDEILELLRLVTRIEVPDVTYCDDLLPMAQQAVRLSRMYAGDASNILYKWTHGEFEEKGVDNEV